MCLFYRCLVAGWGKDAFNGNLQSVVKEVEVPTVTYSDCQTRLRAVPRLGPLFQLDQTSFMCAGGEPGKDACTVNIKYRDYGLND